jgi:hypothetical protein
VSTSAGGNNLGTGSSPWGGLNTLTASLGDATATSLSIASNLYLGSKLEVNQSSNTGVNRGIYWWNPGDTNWTSYFLSSGGTR